MGVPVQPMCNHLPDFDSPCALFGVPSLVSQRGSRGLGLLCFVLALAVLLAVLPSLGALFMVGLRMSRHGKL